MQQTVCDALKSWLARHLRSVHPTHSDANNRMATAGDDSAKREKCSIIIRYNADTQSRAKVLYNSLRVDAEPKSVTTRKLNVDNTTLEITITSSNLGNLRASSNGILENLKTLTEVIDKFEIASEYEYSYF